MKKIFCIMGKSSSGKDSIYKEIVKDSRIEPLVIYTTRPMRENEQEGREYHFVDRGTFEKMKSAGSVIESRTYNTKHGEWTYFTSSSNVDIQKKNYAVIGTIESYRPIRDYYGTGSVIPIYIEVDDGIRLIRAVERERLEEQPKYAELCRRFLADSEDFSDDKLREAGIERRFSNNGSFEECLNEVMGFIESEL